MGEGVDCILGSGPAAVACARELLDRGRKIVVVDPGRRLPPDRAALAADFRHARGGEGYLHRLRALRRSLPRDMQDKKLPFSSPYGYDEVERYLPAQTNNAEVLRSLASGGLSSVWGATVMPMAERSFRNWPIAREDVEPYYRKAATLMDVPVVHDDLTALYPNYGSAAPTALSEQGAQLIANMVNHRRGLAAAGMTFGRCRSAIGAMNAVNGIGCVYCGFCMYGCPFRAIFNAEYVLDELIAVPQVTLRPGRLAVGFEENASGVEVHLRRLDDGSRETLACERLFVACGAATSLRLVAGAQKMFDRTFYLKDTQRISIPVFLRRRCRPGAIPQAQTLGQIFILLNDPELCDELIHLQIYGFNPFITDLLRARFGGLLVREALLRPLLNQMMVVMGYLPGQLSGRIAVTVKPASSSDAGLAPATFNGESNPRTPAAVRAIAGKLNRHARRLGVWPAPALTEVPGASNHLGACLPMRAQPQPGETDRLGRPFGLTRVHVVDAACFSDLPAEHLTYTIMANAMRIAAEASAEGLP